MTRIDPRLMFAGAIACLLGAQAHASTTIGQTAIPLADKAFAAGVVCLNLDEACGGGVLPNTGPPNFHFFGTLQCLMASHILDGVLADVDTEDELQLTFPTPIVNQAGDDIYLAQAEFLGNELGFGTAPLNGFGLRFDNDPGTWHLVPTDMFEMDPLVPAQPFYFTDGGPVEGDAYALWFTTIDLSDFGYAPGASITSFTIRGEEIGSQENDALDIVTVANLNSSPCPADLDGSGKVNSPDLNMLLGGFGCTGGSCDGDIDGDGDTDSADLNALLAAFGDPC